MRFAVVFLLLSLALVGCKNRNIPDVSGVKVDLHLQRFEQDFFTIDTSHIDASIGKLQQIYPRFLQDFVFNILALDPHPDSNKVVEKNMAAFIASYKPLKDSADKVFADMNEITREVKKGMRFLRYYFPEYKQPAKLITFIGPINSYGNVVTTDAMAVGLQMYMGANYSLYSTAAFQEQYPAYISRRFSKEYIPVNCMKSLLDDLYPDNTVGRPLVEQMVQAGKRLYVLDQLMPETEDTLKTGYTEKQLAGCYDNERAIWSFFVQNDLLFSTDPSVTRDYMSDAPMTQAFGNESPGFIGQFVGWQIVKKWMSKNDKKTLAELMKTNNKLIFDEAKYKP